MYERLLSELLDKHASLKIIKVVDRPLNEWISDKTMAEKSRYTTPTRYGS